MNSYLGLFSVRTEADRANNIPYYNLLKISLSPNSKCKFDPPAPCHEAVCMPGYRGNGWECSDIDECIDPLLQPGFIMKIITDTDNTAPQRPISILVDFGADDSAIPKIVID